ncbi:MAG: alpha/beta hydrolase, partial [Pseudomonadales bacterium]|nr:alpha/beta hydrolase [Pseudomonadales bacterium]
GDMLALIDDLGRKDAIWVGHDWGSPVVWNLVSQHPERCRGVASLCVPYATIEQGLDFIVGLVDREIYPEEEFPYGQWEYMRFYEENFDGATRPMDANPRNFVNLIFRKGSPEGEGKPAGTSMARKAGGMLGGASEPPWMPRDEDILGEVEASIYAGGLERNGLFGPNSWYMNHAANTEYFERAPHKVLELPVLFLHARYDYTCYTVKGRLAEPMRELCRDLTEQVVDSGHWMAQEKPADVNRHLVRWMAGKDLIPG